MKAFFGHEWLKRTVIDRVRQHIVQGQIKKALPQRWHIDAGGSAVGCTVHGCDLGLYEQDLGIPILLAALEDAIFEGLPAAEGRGFAARFVSVIQPGADLCAVWPKFAAWLLQDRAFGMAGYVDHRLGKVMNQLGLYYEQGEHNKDRLAGIVQPLIDHCALGGWDSPACLATMTAVILGDAAQMELSGRLRQPNGRRQHFLAVARAIDTAASVAGYAKAAEARQQARELTAARAIELAGPDTVRQSIERCLSKGSLQMRLHIKNAARAELFAEAKEKGTAMGYIAQAQQLLQLLRTA